LRSRCLRHQRHKSCARPCPRAQVLFAIRIRHSSFPILSPLMVSARRLDSWVQRHGRLFPFFPSAGRCAGCVFFRYSKALCFFCCYAQFALFTCVNSKLRCELRTTTESRCKFRNAIELPQLKFLSIFLRVRFGLRKPGL